MISSRRKVLKIRQLILLISLLANYDFDNFVKTNLLL